MSRRRYTSAAPRLPEADVEHATTRAKPLFAGCCPSCLADHAACDCAAWCPRCQVVRLVGGRCPRCEGGAA